EQVLRALARQQVSVRQRRAAERRQECVASRIERELRFKDVSCLRCHAPSLRRFGEAGRAWTAAARVATRPSSTPRLSERCAHTAGLLARRSTGVVRSSRGVQTSVTKRTAPLRPTVAGAASVLRLSPRTEFPFHRTRVRTAAPQDIGSGERSLSTNCGWPYGASR